MALVCCLAISEVVMDILIERADLITGAFYGAVVEDNGDDLRLCWRIATGMRGCMGGGS